ncbi:MAG TPA: PIN domain-containing protein [Thermoanaerobaculia bacterium]
MKVLIDTGPLVALLDRRDTYHAWAKAQLESVDPPLYTCEAVLTEACFLVSHLPGGPQAVLDLVHQGLLVVGLSLEEEVVSVKRLLMRYADQPMALADACMVRLAELNRGSVLLTCDGDFRIYRIDRRSEIPIIIPSDR